MKVEATDKNREIIMKAMAYELTLIFHEKGADAAYTPKEIEEIIRNYILKSYPMEKLH